MIRFIDVGRNKASWTDNVPLEYSAMVRSIKKHHALGSNGIDFTENDDGTAGEIYVGGFRCVGRWELVPEPAGVAGAGPLVDGGGT